MWVSINVTVTLRDEATFVSETIPDGTSYTAGTAFTKTWTIRNTGTTTWNSTYKLRFVSGASVSDHLDIAVSGTVAPNATFTFSKAMTAPASAGTAREDWKLVNGSGTTINVGGSSTVWVSINVGISSTRKGVDYSYSHPSPSGLKAAGYDFAVRYVSGSGAPKDLTASEAQTLQNAGIDIIVIFESTAARILDGYSAGVADANTSVTVATAAGAPQDFFCYFACDFDASLSDQTAINAYLDGAASVLGGVSRVGFYGGYWPIKRVLDAGKAAKGWQTAAWSGGNKDSRISLYQYAGEVIIAGGTCDINDGYGNDLGQWFFSPTPIVATPAITPSGGSFGDSVQVTLACATAGATIRYTTDGSNPTGTSPIYAVPFTLTSSATVKAKAFASGYNESAVASASFTGGPLPTVATPTITPPGGDFSASVQVTLACATSGASIRYTTDGSDPTSGSPVFLVPFTLTSSATVKAKAFASGYNASGVASASFTITPIQTVATPTITPSGGSFSGLVQVTLDCSTSGRTIRYTTDGSDPTSGSPVYAAPFTMTSSATVKAKAFASGYNDSAIVAASFTVTPPVVATPTITPSGGSFSGSVQVTLACETSGSTIRYTIDGSDPTSSSPIYTDAAPFTLTSSATVKAKAFVGGYTDSVIALATFSVTPISTVATPTISPSGGSFNGSVQVALACVTSGATIRYTTDGSDPTGASLSYAGPFTLSSSAVVKAKAYASGYTDSAVASASFTIIPFAITGIGGGPVQPPNSGIFQIEVHSSQPQVTVQVSDDMEHWIDVGTFDIVVGKAYFVDGSAGANTKRFYRLKP